MPIASLSIQVRLRAVLALFATLLVALLSAVLFDVSGGSADPLDQPANKTPILAWAGQRVAVEHDWADYSSGTRVCPAYGANSQVKFGVLYTKLPGSGSFTAELAGNNNDVDLSADAVIVDVNQGPVAGGPAGHLRPNSDCISRVIFESQDQSQVDIVAFATDAIAGDPPNTLATATPRSQQVAFVIYYMKLEDVTLGFVPGSRSGENAGDFTPTTPPVFDPSNDVTSITSNSSADVLARVRVRGWVVADGCPARPAALDSNGGLLPADRCVFPDDWEFIAGGALAEDARPNFDIMTGPGESFLDNAACRTPTRAAGPFSLLDGTVRTLIPALTPANLCGDSNAPHVTAGLPCLSGDSAGCRETVFPSGAINAIDGPMPPALVRLLLSGAGYMKGADKATVYTGNSNLFYDTHIPAEPWITPINSDLSGYQWNTWGIGSKSGLYTFWTSLADAGPEVMSCPGASPCPGDETATGGYALIKIYSDNHGEAMVWVNGDANLLMGSSTLTAVADYPDKRKHYPILSNTAEIDWTIQIQPPDAGTLPPPVSVTFTTIVDEGVTTLEVSGDGPAPPSGFALGKPPVYYDLSTTTTFSGPVTVCITYTGIAFVDEPSLRLHHYDTGSGTWSDVTVSLDTLNDIICGSVDSFSPFTVLEPAAVHDAEVKKLDSGGEVMKLGGDGRLDRDVDFRCRNKSFHSEAIRCVLEVSGLPVGCTATNRGPDKKFGTTDDLMVSAPGGLLVDDTSVYPGHNSKKTFDFRMRIQCSQTPPGSTPIMLRGVADHGGDDYPFADNDDSVPDNNVRTRFHVLKR